MKIQNYFMSVIIVLVTIIFGCTESENTVVQETTNAEALPASLFLSEAPSGIVSIASLKTEAREGDTVTINAVVGGRKQVFVSNRAVMTVIDASLPNACTLPGDSCTTPWDYCCTSPEELLPQMASVQIVDENRAPLSVDLNTVDELKPLNRLVIQGTVGPRLDDMMLVINATGIYVMPL